MRPSKWSRGDDLALVSDSECGILRIMRRPVLVLIFCLLAGLLAWSELRHVDEVEGQIAGVKTTPPLSQVSETKEETPGKVLPMGSTQTTANTPPPAAAGEDKTGPRFKRAYMLSLDKGALTFLEQQDIEGDFAPKRRKPEEWSGMLRCRLLSDTNAVLAEELLPAPDHLCAVLDPKSGSTTKPVQYTPSGPVVFQVRLPRVKGATRLDIIRIIQPGEPPLEGLLGSIPLPKS
jgi:hypothetical protein